jgi:Coenzyme PQQ synthesis protein D (PqqD)
MAGHPNAIEDRKMSPASRLEQRRLLDAVVTVPDHVVYREFAEETVLLNLETGQYHGVNLTGGTILRTLESGATVGSATAELAEHYGRNLDEMESDVCSFCNELLERGLVRVEERS